MSLDTPHSRRHSKLLVVGVVLASGIALSVFAYYLSDRNARQLRLAAFTEQADQRIGALGQRLRRAMYASMTPITRFRHEGHDRRTMFRDLAEARLTSNDDVKALMWVPRIPREELEAHQRTAREEGLPDYHVHSFSDDAEDRDGPYFPVYYAEPQADNQTALGLDLATVPQLQPLINDVAEGSRANASRPLLWQDDTGSSLTTFVFRALTGRYRVEEGTDDLQAGLHGFVVAVVEPGAIMEDTLGRFPPGIDIVLLTDTENGPAEPLLRYDSTTGQALPIASPSTTELTTPLREIRLPGRTWSARGVVTAAYLNQHRSPLPLQVLLTGLLLTGIITAYLNSVLGRSAKIAELVIRRTAELEEVNEQLSHERFLLATLLNQSTDFIYFKDRDSCFLRISRALASYFGLPDPDSAIGTSDFDNFPEDQAGQFRHDEMRIMETGEPVIDKEEYQENAVGRQFWLSTSKVPLRDESGEVIGTFGISRDITKRKKIEIELAEAKSAAEAANRAKSDFVANISHEIRTPMNAIIGLTELVLETDLADSQREYLKMVLESGESLLAIINDVLDFSKIEAGKLELDRTQFELRDLIGDTLKALAFRAHHKGLELAYRISSDIPNRLLGDPGRLRQVIVNLIGNAVKFTDVGEVVLELTADDFSRDRVRLHTVVRDTGVGISAENHADVFDAFQQVDSSSTRRFTGSGLGLAICTRLVDMMDGRIWLESEPGKGSQFHFTACFHCVGDGQDATPSTTLIGTPILVVDDNESNRGILDEMLGNWGLNPTCASGALEAIELARDAFEKGQPFPMILIDSAMPEIDGFELAGRIQDDPDLGSRIVMMLTSGARPEDISRCGDLGIAACLLKPVKQSELFNAIFSSLGSRRADDTVRADLPEPPPDMLPPQRVLLVEDSLVNQKLAVGLLSKYGHEVVVANHGREAIALFEAERFDLVLMDVQMPEMDGFEATAAIRAMQGDSPQRTPIIAMTAHAMKGDRERCLKAGMDGYVAKPIRAAVLFQVITKVLDGNRLPPADQPEAAAPEATGSDDVDWEAASEATGGDRKLLHELVQGFLDECPRLVADVRKAVESTDAKQLAAAAHQLKGAIRYFGPGAAFQLAWQLEQEARLGNLGDTRSQLERLESALARLIENIAAQADHWRS